MRLLFLVEAASYTARTNGSIHGKKIVSLRKTQSRLDDS